MKGITLIISIAVLVAYIAIGGVVFHFLEDSSEEDQQKFLLNAREVILANNTCLTSDELNTFIVALQRAHQVGVTLSNNQTSLSNWDVYSSIFFATTVVTTIGYGNLAPTTLGGRVFCIVYAVIGIPLFLVVASFLAERMKMLSQSLYEKRRKCNLGIIWNRTMPIACLLLSTLLFVFLPSLIFHLVEDDWSYAASLYYSFITLTTIGFGDYVASTDTASSVRGWYRIFVCLWILIGLAWMGTLIAISQENITKSFQKEEDKLTAIREKNNSRVHLCMSKCCSGQEALEEKTNQKEDC